MVTRTIPYFNLDMIISVGYRVNSKRGIKFRQWANKVLKEYLIKGYAVNERIPTRSRLASCGSWWACSDGPYKTSRCFRPTRPMHYSIPDLLRMTTYAFNYQINTNVDHVPLEG